MAKRKQVGLPKNPDVEAFRAVKQSKRIKQVTRGKSLFRRDLTDEQIEGMLVGRKITWIIRPDPDAAEQITETVVVHPQGFRVVKYPSGRGVEFQEVEGTSNIGGVRGKPNRYRAVLLKRIHTIK